MNGVYIKKILVDLDVTQSALSRMLGDSPQNLSSALNSPDIKSGLLEKIAKALGQPMSRFYEGTEYECLFEKPEAPMVPANLVALETYERLVRENERLRYKIEQLQKGANND